MSRVLCLTPAPSLGGGGAEVTTGKIIRTSISMCLFPCTALKRYLGLSSGKCHLIHNRWSWHQNPFQTQCITAGFLWRRNNTFQQAFVSLTVEIAGSMAPLSTVSPDEFLSTPWKNRLSHRLCQIKLQSKGNDCYGWNDTDLCQQTITKHFSTSRIIGCT